MKNKLQQLALIYYCGLITHVTLICYLLNINLYIDCYIEDLDFHMWILGRHGCDHMVVAFTTTNLQSVP